jgi:anti-anti-sigma factor
MSGPTRLPRANLCMVERIGNMLRLRGEIDQANAVALTIRLAAEVRLGVTHLDLSGVTYCGAAGVRMLLAARAAQPREAAGLLLSCSPIVFRILHIARVATTDGIIVRLAPSTEGRRSEARR